MTTSTLMLLGILNNLLMIFNKDQTLPWFLAQSSTLPINSREILCSGKQHRGGTEIGAGG